MIHLSSRRVVAGKSHMESAGTWGYWEIVELSKVEADVTMSVDVSSGA